MQVDVTTLPGTVTGLEELPVRGGRGAIAPQGGMRVLSVLIRDAGLSQLVGLRSRMEDPLPGNLLRAHSFRGCCHAPGAEIGRIGQNPGQHGWDAAWWLLGTDVRELIGKPGPVMNLHQEIRYLDQRVHVGQFPFQLLGRRRHFAGQRSNNELPGLKPNTVELAIAGAVGKPLEVEVERLSCFGKIADSILWHTEPEIIRGFQGGESRLRYELFVHRPEGATALNADVARAQSFSKNSQCRNLVEAAIWPSVSKDQFTDLGAEMADWHALGQSAPVRGLQGLERPDGCQQRVMFA